MSTRLPLLLIILFLLPASSVAQKLKSPSKIVNKPVSVDLKGSCHEEIKELCPELKKAVIADCIVDKLDEFSIGCQERLAKKVAKNEAIDEKPSKEERAKAKAKEKANAKAKKKRKQKRKKAKGKKGKNHKKKKKKKNQNPGGMATF